MMLDEKNPVILANNFSDQLVCSETRLLFVQSIIADLQASTSGEKYKNTTYWAAFNVVEKNCRRDAKVHVFYHHSVVRFLKNDSSSGIGAATSEDVRANGHLLYPQSPLLWEVHSTARVVSSKSLISTAVSFGSKQHGNVESIFHHWNICSVLQKKK